MSRTSRAMVRFSTYVPGQITTVSPALVASIAPCTVAKRQPLAQTWQAWQTPSTGVVPAQHCPLIGEAPATPHVCVGWRFFRFLRFFFFVFASLAGVPPHWLASARAAAITERREVKTARLNAS
jgi:hypothetical protein